jgi:RNA recognition motif-containing protein
VSRGRGASAEGLGEVTDVNVPKGKGFMFVTMSTPEEAAAAIEKLHDTATDLFVRALPYQSNAELVSPEPKCLISLCTNPVSNRC